MLTNYSKIEFFNLFIQSTFWASEKVKKIKIIIKIKIPITKII